MNKEYITVTQLNKYIKYKIDTDPHLNTVFLKGEISNFKEHTRGHLYFTIKDEETRINAIMFSSHASKVNFQIVDGMKVLVVGKVSVYEATGNYQIYVEQIEEDGLGNLYIKFEELKKKLKEEGLFDDKYKKSIPRIPKRIGIITASTGAAIKDILSTLKRRWPIVETILFPSLVQGPSAAEDIVRNIEISKDYDLDLLIVGRGGGSIEDLWPFNEEIVARAIFNLEVPVISAVGHEVDFTISDFVADLRAPTPTGAAEMAVPNLNDLNIYLNQLKIRIAKSIKNNLTSYLTRLNNIESSYILQNPMAMYEIKEQKLITTIERANNLIFNLNKTKQYEFKILLHKLKLLNPLGILEKGYSVVSMNAKIIKDSEEVEINDEMTIKLFKGKLKVIVKERL